MKTKKRRSFCPYCGNQVETREEEGIPRDFCASCHQFFYENPLPVVSCILMAERKILLVKRGKKPYRGKWCLPTGFAETGESIEQAALRELEEETGIRGRILGLIDADSQKNYFYGDLIFITFEVEPVGGELARGGDSVAAQYVTIEKIPKLAFRSNDKAVKMHLRNKAESWAIVDSFSRAIDEGGKRKKKNLLSDHLLDLIENNSDRIAQNWVEEITRSQSTSGYHHLDQDKLLQRVNRVLSQFRKWLGGFHRDKEIRDLYRKLGSERRKEGIRLSELVSALNLTKKHIWKFALSRGMWQKTLDIYMALELDRRIVVFFDKAVFYATRGYEEEDLQSKKANR